MAGIEKQKQHLGDEAKRVYENLISKTELAKLNADEAQAKATAAEKEVQDLNKLKVEYDVLNRKKVITESTYQLLINKTKEYDLARKDVVQNMNLNDPAEMGIRPIKPRKLMILAMGIFGGLGFALSLAFLLNHLDDTVKSQEDVELFFGRRRDVSIIFL